MTDLTDERLAELINRPWIGRNVEDTQAALRELQERREREGSMTPVDSGTPRTDAEAAEIVEATASPRVALRRMAAFARELERELATQGAVLESLQQRWASRPLSHPDGEALIAENERLRKVLVLVSKTDKWEHDIGVKVCGCPVCAALQEQGNNIP